MTTARLSAFRFQNEDEDSNGQVALPDLPAAFAYVEFLVGSAKPVAFGGGRFNNRYRNACRIVVYVFVPRGQGLTAATDLAEAIATLFIAKADHVAGADEASGIKGLKGAARLIGQLMTLICDQSFGNNVLKRAPRGAA